VNIMEIRIVGTGCVLILLFVISVMVIVRPADAANRVNILVVGQDNMQNAVRRDRQLFGQVLELIKNSLVGIGVDIVDERAATLNKFSQNRVHRGEAELVDIAQSIRHPPIDILVLFSIIVDSEKKRFATKVRGRLFVRALNISTSGHIGTFDSGGAQYINAPRNCDRSCVRENIGPQILQIAKQNASALRTKLTHLMPNQSKLKTTMSFAYTIDLYKFSESEISQIQKFLMEHDTYIQHRLLRVSRYKTVFWYNSSGDGAALNKTLVEMLNSLGVKGQVLAAGNELRITKTTKIE
jgi:hypothetical protein